MITKSSPNPMGGLFCLNSHPTYPKGRGHHSTASLIQESLRYLLFLSTSCIATSLIDLSSPLRARGYISLVTVSLIIPYPIQLITRTTIQPADCIHKGCLYPFMILLFVAAI